MSKPKDPETVPALKRRIRELEEDLADQIRFKERFRAETDELKRSGVRNREVLNSQIKHLGGQFALCAAELVLREAAYQELKGQIT